MAEGGCPADSPQRSTNRTCLGNHRACAAPLPRQQQTLCRSTTWSWPKRRLRWRIIKSTYFNPCAWLKYFSWYTSKIHWYWYQFTTRTMTRYYVNYCTSPRYIRVWHTSHTSTWMIDRTGISQHTAIFRGCELAISTSKKQQVNRLEIFIPRLSCQVLKRRPAHSYISEVFLAGVIPRKTHPCSSMTSPHSFRACGRYMIRHL